MRIDSRRALAWRLRRHDLLRPSTDSSVELARRLLALSGWPLAASELSVRLRMAATPDRPLQQALRTSQLVRSYAFRGGSYVMAPDVAALVLTLRTATKVWETKRWQQQAGFTLTDWDPFREAVCGYLADGPLTRAEIAGRLRRSKPLAHLSEAALGAGADTLYKPLHWWGDIACGPDREGTATFRLLRGDPHWPAPPDVDEAGREAIRLYLASFAPATPANLQFWIGDGLGVPRRRLEGWRDELGDVVATLDVHGERAHALAADADDIAAAERDSSVCLLPAFDPWLLATGTADTRLVPPAHRRLFSSGANPVLRGGIAVGTWRRDGGDVAVTWFPYAGRRPVRALREATARLGRAVDADLSLVP